MKVHINDGWLIFVLGLLLIVALPRIAFATPFIWVDTVNGSDSSADPYQPDTPLRTYDALIARMIKDGADTVGVKVKPGSALPSADEAEIINRHKRDRVVTHNKREVIPGHGELPSTDVETSAEAGLKVTTTWVWLTYESPAGLAEYAAPVVRTVEAY